MATKRTASVAHDATLERVARALEGLTCVRPVSAPIAGGTRQEVPLPRLALRLDPKYPKELHFPVGKREVKRIKAAGTAYQENVGNAVAWRVASDGVELRNAGPRWDAFVEACFESVRAPLGIPRDAQIGLSLRELLLVEKGATFQPPQHLPQARRDGIFGTLLVVLPSVFTGGDVAVTEHPEQWHPAVRSSDYDVSFAVFHDHCVYEAERLTRGAALCLVYDLRTTTPWHMRSRRGTESPQPVVQKALADFFGMTPPASLVKRFKIQADVWRTAKDFLSDRTFAYLVKGDSFSTLQATEQEVAHCLEAFCAQSQGQYALYHTRVVCVRSIDDGDDGDDGDDEEELHVVLKAPWFKHGETMGFELSPVRVEELRDIAPLGQAQAVRVHRNLRGMDEEEHAICARFDLKPTRIGRTHALVVQPTLIAEPQLAKLDIEHAMMRMGMVLSRSRDEAITYARRVLQHRKPWNLCDQDTSAFRHFLWAIKKINDLELFRELLRTVRPRNSDLGGCLRATVVDHFGWDACADALAESIRAGSTLNDRINFINAIVDESSGAIRINQVLGPLLALHPWTTIQSTPTYFTDVGPFARLLDLAALVSTEKLLQVVTVHAETLIWIVVPALERFARTRQIATMRPVVERVWDLFQKAKLVVRNEPFASVRLPPHYAACDDLQAFLKSTETQMEMALTGFNNDPIQHIQTVFNDAIPGSARVSVKKIAGNNVRLTKSLGTDMYRLLSPTMEAETVLRSLMATLAG